MSELGKLRLIAAIGPDRELAYVGDPNLLTGMLWDVPTDGAYFHERTKRFGGVVLMASGTWSAINRPLSDRKTYVLSNTLPDDLLGVTVLRSLDPFLDEQRDKGVDVWIAGGQSLYEQTIARADELWITKINGKLKHAANRWFPDFSATKFALSSQQPVMSENGYTFQFEIYTRK